MDSREKEFNLEKQYKYRAYFEHMNEDTHLQELYKFKKDLLKISPYLYIIDHRGEPINFCNQREINRIDYEIESRIKQIKSFYGI